MSLTPRASDASIGSETELRAWLSSASAPLSLHIAQSIELAGAISIRRSQDITLWGNDVALISDGSGRVIELLGRLRMRGVSLGGGVADLGGCIIVTGGKFEFSEASISNCSASAAGGGMLVAG